MPVPSPGSTIPLQGGESFTIGRLLGSGGMGSVVEASHAPSGRRVALKFLHDDLLDHPTIPARFAREVELATSLTTAHVARTYGVDRTPQGTPFMIMELLEGRDLNALIRAEGPLPPARAARILSQACEGLEEAHARGIVHRDLKPENLFLTVAADGSDWVKVLDFGISKVLDEQGKARGPALTRVGTTVGTPEYMAPEQLRGAQDLDGSADVYSLGCVLYEAVTRRRPFTSPQYAELVRLVCTTDPVHVSQLRSDLPAAFCDVIMRAIARDRRARIPTARALREALAPWASGRKAEGTVVMEPGPPSGPHSMPHASPHAVASARMSPSPGPAPAAAIAIAAVPGPTRGGETIVEDHAEGSKAWIFAVIGVVALLVAAGVVVLLWPSVVGLH